jgi:sortase A
MYTYIKAPPGHTLRHKSVGRDRVKLVISATLLTAGVMAFTSVIYPMITYQAVYAPKFATSPTILGTTDPTALLPAPPVEVESTNPSVVPEVVNTALDYTNAEAWYGHVGSYTFDHLVYSLSIPKLRIKNAIVRDDHTDLKESLIHYPGTAQPGDLGNGVIFGHSVLPQFFNPNNYHTIFSTLHTLEVGDEFTIAAGPATYTYKITLMYVTTPEDLTPLAQSYGARTITLITCTPPGTYLKRLIIKATLI